MKKKILLIFTFIIVFFGFACSTSNLLDGLTIPKIIVTGEQTISVGDTFYAKALVTPEDNYSQNVIWSSTNKDIASVNDDGLVTGKAKGSTSIVAKSADDETLSGRLYIVVSEKAIEYTENAPTEISISGDKTAYVNTYGYYRFTTKPVNASQDVEWTSSNQEVATVDKFGIVTFLKKGEVIITVYSEKDHFIKQSINVKVEEMEREENHEEAVKKVINDTKNSILGVANYEYNDKHVLVKQSIGSGFVYNVQKVLSNGTITDILSDSKQSTYHYYLITNKHVVMGSDVLKIYIHSIEEEVPASLVYYDSKVDLAVVEFKYEEYIKPLEFGNSDNLEHGEYVLAIGNPEGFEYSSSATLGITSFPLRYISDDTDGDGINDWDAAYIQHDASINPGNSGGPLLNLYGQVIGINTLKFASLDIDNMGFSIPTKTIIELLPFLEKGTCPTRAKIGVTIIALCDLLASDYASAEYKYIIPEGVTSGLYITAITPESVSDGKLQKDDIMIQFNGIDLKKSIQLRAELNSIVVGSNTEIEVKVLRGGEVVSVILVF